MTRPEEKNRKLPGPDESMNRTHVRIVFLIVVGAVCPAWAAQIEFTVSETVGLRRFGYPVTASLECPTGSLNATDKVRLVDAYGKEVPAQFTVMSQWPDHSTRGIDVDFMSSPGPNESITYRLEIGTGPSQPIPSGLVVTETPDEIEVASSAIRHRIRRDGKPLLTSIAFGKFEFLGERGVNTSIAPGPVEIVKRGPFNVQLKMGSVRLEYVNSKSWVKITQAAESAREITLDASFQLTKRPLLWDFGAGGRLYGALSKSGQSALLKHERSGWQVFIHDGNNSSVFAKGESFDGWGHFADADQVVAFGIADRDRTDPIRVELGADGRMRVAAPGTELTTYFHVVRQPVPVTAVTSPQAMLAPLRVTSGKQK